MKNLLKIILALVFALCTLVASLIFVACSSGDDKDDGDKNGGQNTEDTDGDPAKDGYVITVLYPDGKAVSGTDAGGKLRTGVYLTDANDEEVASSDLNGAGLAQIAYYTPGEYTINLYNVPQGYEFTESVKTQADKAFYTVNLSLKTSLDYTVTVKYPDGTPASGVSVKFLKGETLVDTVTANSDGKAVLENAVPAEYSVEVVTDGDCYIHPACKTAINGGNYTVTLYPLLNATISADNLLNETQIAEWDEALNSKDLTRFDVEAESHLFNADVAAGAEIMYAFTSPKTGTARLLVKDNDNYRIKFYGANIDGDPTNTITGSSSNRNQMFPLSVTEGQIYYFSCSSANRQANNYDFVISLPVPEPSETTVSNVGSVDLSFTETNVAIIRFAPTVSGVYTFTSHTDKYDVKLVSYSYATNKPLYDEDGNEIGDDDGGEGTNFSFSETVRDDHIGGVYLFYITVKDDVEEDSFTINVTVERAEINN